MPTIDTMPKPAQVISIAEVRDRHHRRNCDHKRVMVDEMLMTVECIDCREKLNPIAVLARFGREESEWQRRLVGMREERQRLEERVRCKCQHCGKMTRI